MASNPNTADMSSTSQRWYMGLDGLWGKIANLTAVTLICVMFYQDWREALAVAREDRTLFRSSLTQLSKDSQDATNQARINSDRQWGAIQKNSEVIERTATLIEKMIRQKPE